MLENEARKLAELELAERDLEKVVGAKAPAPVYNITNNRTTFTRRTNIVQNNLRFNRFRNVRFR